MKRQFCQRILLAAAIFSGISGLVIGGDGCCDKCGRKTECHQICRLVCEEQKEEITCWGCKCEDFCVPGPSHPDCKHCDCVCQSCQKDGIQSKPKKFVWFDWTPSCAKVHTKRMLMKGTYKKKIPGHKWVVENVCCQCQAGLLDDGCQAPGE